MESGSTGNTTIFTTVFTGLDEDALNVLREVAVTRDYPAMAKLCHQGAREEVFYVVVSGSVAVVRTLDDGEEQLLNIIRPRSYFGEMGLIDDQPRMADCIALEPTRVLEIGKASFGDLVEHSPAIAYSIMQRVMRNLRSMDEQAIADLRAKNKALEQAYADLQAAQSELVEMERLERELEIAAEVQRSLLPETLPAFPPYDFAAFLRPARQVGGDFYDVQSIDEEHVGILIADVADKSVQAALFMAVSRTLFLVTAQRVLDPEAVAREVHRWMLTFSGTQELFVTAFYGVLNLTTGRLRYINAGHERPLLCRPGAGVSTLPSRGRFLGMMDPLIVELEEMMLQPGDRLLLFSDGATDAVNGHGDSYGEERLAALLKTMPAGTAQQLVDGVADVIESWSGRAAQFDDLTLLAVTVGEATA
jgi:serine phosphatase RsbU (regulator of sigma subunit)